MIEQCLHKIWSRSQIGWPFQNTHVRTLSRVLTDFTRIWYRVWSHNSRSSTKFKVKESKVNVTVWHNISIKNITSQEQISWPTSNFVEYYPTDKCKRDIFKVIKWNNSAVDCSISLKFFTVSSRQKRCTTNVQAQRVKGQGYSIT